LPSGAASRSVRPPNTIACTMKRSSANAAREARALQVGGIRVDCNQHMIHAKIVFLSKQKGNSQAYANGWYLPRLGRGISASRGASPR
jgi:hypothetical protein